MFFTSLLIVNYLLSRIFEAIDWLRYMMNYDCIVIGGGAAGLMCAAVAGERGLKVAVLEGSNKVGKKILMSGGGRCNFTNYDVSPDNYLSHNSHFCKSALSRYTQYDFLALVAKYDLAYHEKTLGQLFCDNKAKDILAILLAECERSSVDIQVNCNITQVMRLEETECTETEDVPKNRYRVVSNGLQYECHSVVVASGGLSIPTLGSSGFGYEIAKQFGLPLIERRAGLVPFTFDAKQLNYTKSLAGVAMPASIECGGQAFSEALLFTHKGISGPAVLQVSSYWRPGACITIDFLPSYDLSVLIQETRQQGKKISLKTLLSQYIPSRFVEVWLTYDPKVAKISTKALANVSKAEMEVLEQHFHHWQCIPSGTEGYKKAEVTLGGVDTDGVSSKTFEAKQVDGLYFIGEVLDVTGWLGGYNFQWAWASGYCAGQSV